ncbi:Y-family DNA polymerase [Bradyrhizobium sp. USDA 4486]
MHPAAFLQNGRGADHQFAGGEHKILVVDCMAPKCLPRGIALRGPASRWPGAQEKGPGPSTASQRKIIHIDMNVFYASEEQRDNPDLPGKPVGVGGSSAAWSPQPAMGHAKFGVRSAMPSVTAKRQCPDLIFVKPPRMKSNGRPPLDFHTSTSARLLQR